MAITIKDLAELAGVSKGTVSRVMNGGPGVGEETRKRILKLIEELDYEPNASAQGLAANRSNNIGVIIPHTGTYSMSTAYWPALLTAITDIAAAKGYNVLLSTSRAEEEVESAYKTILRGRRIDGLIIGAERFGRKQLAELLRKDFPFVMVGRSLTVPHYCVDVDNVGGAQRMTEHLIRLGHRQIAMLTGPESYSSVRDRVQGFRKAMNDAGLRADRVYYCPYWTEQAVEVSKKLLQEKDRVTAVFAAAGDLIVGVLQAAREKRLRIPADLALVSFDDHPLYDHFSPQITAVSQPLDQLGRAAVTQLFKLMEGKAAAQSVILPTTIIVRETCGSKL